MDLSQFPRRKYTANETPLEPMPRLTSILGSDVNLWIKRDDMLGLTGGGNKTRKLEWVMADAIQKGADTIVTCGAVQSNHCRLTLSACVKEGLRCCLVLEERVPGSYNSDATGNNYLFRLLGAEQIIVVKAGEAQDAVQKLADELSLEGRNVYCIPGGASNDIGALGYCACAAEIQHQQFVNQLPQFEAIVTASGSGGTHSGLVTGLSSLRSPIKVIGISTRHPKSKQTDHIYNLATNIANKLQVPPPEKDAVVVFDNYVGDGYSLPTKEMEEAITLFARTEGILLDPVYSGKAAAGFIDLVRKEYFTPGSNIIFLHTGGAPSLYHYQPISEDVCIGMNDNDDDKEEKKE